MGGGPAARHDVATDRRTHAMLRHGHKQAHEGIGAGARLCRRRERTDMRTYMRTHIHTYERVQRALLRPIAPRRRQHA